ncbi:MAG: insulinase family protein [Eubacterium sp.]|nr:insulinase family protein [Eubacterium sp.]
MLKDLNTYTIEQEQSLPEVNGTGYVLRHNKTKARVVVISNDDPNKVFAIGFRTPASNSKGIQHIIEHTVLCGSKKYPAKDPFVELAKGSLNTFLNAMTYSDKTVYPVASCNDKDFRNLMDVYLDAVFHPNIYDREEIFMQEGWHYELSDADAPLIYNGVVYNEMKGVYSSPDAVLGGAVGRTLFPDSVYRNDSGGNPKDIPSLTREEYLDYHRNYYHPSNSYIYLYGDLDAEDALGYIDSEYLSDYDYLEVDSAIRLQEPLPAPADAEETYALAEGEEPSENAYLTCNAVIATSLDKRLRVAFDILSYVLLDAPGAPLCKAIIDAGLSADVESSYDTSVLQPTFSVVAHNADAEKREVFKALVEETLERLASEGLDKKSLRAALHRFEFEHKEGNFGRYPKGLMLGLDAFETWLYDDTKALELFSMNEVYDDLKEKIDTDYFEQLIRTYLIENPHKAYVTLVPEIGKDRREAEALEKLLEEKKASYSEAEIEAVVRETAHLKAYQEEPTSAEDLEKIPMLSREDIGKESRKLKNDVGSVDGTPLISHSIFTNGIGYLDIYFDLQDFTTEELQLIALMSELYRSVPTEKYTLGELTNEINLSTGGITVSFGTIVKQDPSDYGCYFMLRMKALEEEMIPGVTLAEELLLRSKLSDRKRLKEVIAEIYSGLRTDLVSSGHVTAAIRARSHFSEMHAVKERTEGIEYYRFISGLNGDFDAKYDSLSEALEAVRTKLLKKARVTVSYTNKEKMPEDLQAAVASFLSALGDGPMGEKPERGVLPVKKEGFTTASQVQYVATAGDFRTAGLPDSGALNVLQILFAYDYLWIRVRVKGGAYGAMCDFARDGASYLTSYRDPNLEETFAVYKGAEEYLKNFDCSDRDMLKYIIGAISKVDTPLTPSAEGLLSFLSYMMGRTDADRQKNRDELLATDQEKIRSLAPYLAAVLSGETLCVVGSQAKIEASAGLFDTVESLL